MTKHHNYNSVPVRQSLTAVEICLNWRDAIGESGKTFQTVQELADFLRANRPLAEAVGYVAKKNEPVDFYSLLEILGSTHRSFFKEFVTYVSAANTERLNTFFKTHRAVFKPSNGVNGVLIIENTQVLIEFDQAHGRITFQLKNL